MRTLISVVAGLAVLTIILIVAGNMIGGGEYKAEKQAAQGGDTMAKQRIAEDLKPIGQVDLAQASTGGAATASLSGEAIVKKTCSACHGSGVLGAPKIGDHAAWAERYKPGLDAMLKIAVNGKGNMPPRGGAGYNDDEMRSAIIYMLGQSGIKVAAAAAKPAAAADKPAAAAAGGKWTVDLAKGKAHVTKVCAACHASGVLGAPKIGDHAAWAERYKAGKEQMLKLAISGIRAMPPRGGSTFNDQQMKDAIAYMLHESGIDVTK